MSDNNKVVEDVKSKTDEDKAKDFAKAYEQLCEAHQMKIVAVPVYKARDDGTFSLIIQLSIGKLPQQ